MLNFVKYLQGQMALTTEFGLCVRHRSFPELRFAYSGLSTYKSFGLICCPPPPVPQNIIRTYLLPNPPVPQNIILPESGNPYFCTQFCESSLINKKYSIIHSLDLS